MIDHDHARALGIEQFGLPPVSRVDPLDAGNIQQSVLLHTDDGAFVLQALNNGVFTDAAGLMSNVVMITERLREVAQPTIEFLAGTDGSHLHVAGSASWRCYRWVEGHTPSTLDEPDSAQAVARAFGRYASAIADLPLVEHLPGYHDFDARVGRLADVIARDPHERLVDARTTVDEVVRAVDRLRLSSAYELWRELPVRNAHNDAKGPNCVVTPGGGRTVIDLDTTMPGTVLADIGELVRSSTRGLTDPTPEAVMAQIEAVNRGFVSGYGADLTDEEHRAMLLAGPLLTTENAVRFLTDHLEGDVYYDVAAPGDNLHRAIEQVTLAQLQMAAIDRARSGE